MSRRSVLLSVLAVVAVAALVVLPAQEWLLVTLDWSSRNPGAAQLLFVATYVVAAVCLLPCLPLTLAAGAIFGVVKGTVLVSIGSTLGATAAFFVGRTVARRWVARKVEAWPRLHALDRAVEHHGLWVVLLTRLSPAFPFFLVNYAFGVTRLRPAAYIVGSLVGMLPLTIAYVYAGSLAVSATQALAGEAQLGATGWVLLGLGLVTTATVTALVTRTAQRFLDREIEDEEREIARAGGRPEGT